MVCNCNFQRRCGPCLSVILAFICCRLDSPVGAIVVLFQDCSLVVLGFLGGFVLVYTKGEMLPVSRKNNFDTNRLLNFVTQKI